MQAQLLGYLRSAIQNFPDVTELGLKQFKHGQSNPTYLIQVSSLVYCGRALLEILHRSFATEHHIATDMALFVFREIHIA